MASARQARRPRASALSSLAAVALCASLPPALGAGAAGEGLATGGECAAEVFPSVGVDRVRFEGPSSRSALAYRFYDADRVVRGRRMRDWLRPALAFWHTQRGTGADPFGQDTRSWEWGAPREGDDQRGVDAAKRRVLAHFELMELLGLDLWCFHDRDIAPVGATFAETVDNLREVVDYAASLQRSERFNHVRVLWGTAQLFAEPHYMNGAATSPQPEVFARAAAQVKEAMDATAALNGTAYVFWGGREGYQTLLNTDVALELDNQAALLRMAAAYKDGHASERFRDAQLLIEPKPQEPTKHQYDWDTATTVGFLRKHGLEGSYKINVECNHATLSGHSCFHETELARLEGMLGNVDANQGDPQVGWDTDEFLTDVTTATLLGLSILRNDGLYPGGINFDAKLRRESTTPLDLVIAHVSGLDALARGLLAADALLEEGHLDSLVRERYAGWNAEGGSLGARIRRGEESLESLAEMALAGGADGIEAQSSRQELAERYLSYAL